MIRNCYSVLLNLLKDGKEKGEEEEEEKGEDMRVGEMMACTFEGMVSGKLPFVEGNR